MKEFVKQIENLFVQSVASQSNTIQDQAYQKSIQAIIESNIILPIYEEERFEELDYDKESDFKKGSISIVSNRYLATKKILEDLCNPNRFTRAGIFEVKEYDNIIELITSDPSVALCCIRSNTNKW